MAISKQVRANVARNLRRQIDRRIKQAQAAAQSAKNDFLAQAYNRKIEKLENAKQNTYLTSKSMDGKRVLKSDKDVRKGLQQASQELMTSQYLTEKGRRNLASTQSQLNAASAGAASTFTKAEAKIFFRATQNAWQRPGVSVKERIPAILEYYGYENLSELVADVLTLNQKAVETSKLTYTEELTPEQRAAADEESDIKEAQQSPQYLTEVIEFPDPSGLTELRKA